MRAVNLIPPEQRESGVNLAGRSGGAALIVVVLVLGMAVLAFMYGTAKHSESSSKAELASVNAELVAVRAQAGKLAPYKSFIAMAKQRVQDVSGLVASRFDWSHAFHELGRVLPGDVSLTTLHGQVGSGTGSGSASSSSSSSTPGGAAAPSSATPPGSTPLFSVSGCAKSQSEVAQTLQRLRLMDGVADVELQSSTAAPKAGGSSGGATAAASSGTCGAGGATFSATIAFAGLPSAPPTNPPAAGAGGAAQ